MSNNKKGKKKRTMHFDIWETLPAKFLLTYTYVSIGFYTFILLLSVYFLTASSFLDYGFLLLSICLVFIIVNIKIVHDIHVRRESLWLFLVGWYMVSSIISIAGYAKIDFILSTMAAKMITLLLTIVNVFIMIYIMLYLHFKHKTHFNLSHWNKLYGTLFILFSTIIIIVALAGILVEVNSIMSNVDRIIKDMEGRTYYEGFLMCGLESKDRDLCLTVLSITRSDESNDFNACRYIDDEFLKYTCERGS